MTPSRTCVGCRRVTPADQLVRIVSRSGGALEIGRTLPGRGAWLCRGSEACVEAAVRRKALARALRAEVTPEAVASLREHLAERGRIEGDR